MWRLIILPLANVVKRLGDTNADTSRVELRKGSRGVTVANFNAQYKTHDGALTSKVYVQKGAAGYAMLSSMPEGMAAFIPASEYIGGMREALQHPSTLEDLEYRIENAWTGIRHAAGLHITDMLADFVGEDSLRANIANAFKEGHHNLYRVPLNPRKTYPLRLMALDDSSAFGIPRILKKNFRD